MLNAVASVVFLAACLSPQLDPATWWPVSLMGLGFAFIVVTLLAFIILWLVFKPRYVLLSLLPLLIGYKSIATFFAFNATPKFSYLKDKNAVRLAHWNVARFMEWRRNNNKGSQTRLKMMDQIKEQDADILCFQEFFTSTDTVYYNNLRYVMKELGYPYYCFAQSNDGYLQWFGNAIFSRLPIIDSGKVYFPHSQFPETVLYADLVHNRDTFRVYTTHLQSVAFKKQDFDNIEEIKDGQKNPLQDSRGLFGKVRRAMAVRREQADIIKEMLSNNPYPALLTGDFNDVPNSFAYATIKGDKFQDLFLEKGFGIGRTFSGISPTLRIDYVLATKEFETLQFNRIVRQLSDHYMLVADVRLKPPTP